MAMAQAADQGMAGVRFRRKDGNSQSLGVIGTRCREGDGVAIAVLERVGAAGAPVS
jgi:hypothetical protein